MAYFWQLSGPGSHFERRWDGGDPNQNIANVVFENLNPLKVKTESAGEGVTLVVGVKDNGSSQILIPESKSYLCRSLRKWKHYPYASSEFASLSPMHVETPERLFALLDERQNSRKVTKAKKMKSDVSKANGKFCDGPRNLTRARFERGRTFWRLLTQAEDAPIYGLPYPSWIETISILSFAFSFWRPDGSGRVSAEHLLIASITEFNLQSQDQGQSWSYRIEEQAGLQNADETDFSINNVSSTLPQKEAVKRLQGQLNVAAARGPVVLLLHDFGVAERGQLSSLGFDVSKWIDGLGPLLGYNDEESALFKNRYTKERSRSRSPRRTSHRESKVVKDEKDEKLKAASASVHPPKHYTDGTFYVVNMMELYRAVTGKYWDRLTPNVIFDVLTRRRERTPRNIEVDSTHIMQAWLAMVKGPFIDEQTAFLNNQDLTSVPHTTPQIENAIEDPAQSNAGQEVAGLHSAPAVVQQRPFVDPFQNDSDSDWD